MDLKFIVFQNRRKSKSRNHMLQLNVACGNQRRDYVMTLMQSITNHMIRYNRTGREKIYGPFCDVYMDINLRMKRLQF